MTNNEIERLHKLRQSYINNIDTNTKVNVRFEPESPQDWLILAGVQTHAIDFTVIECIGKTLKGKPCFQLRDTDCSPVFTEDESQAEIFLSGSIKWDGCSNLTWFPDDDGYHHFCGRKDNLRMAILINRLYAICTKFMPAWDNYLED